MEESEAWIREKSSILGSQTCGKDLSSVLKLLHKHKSLAGELLARRNLLQNTMKRGKQILTEKSFGTQVGPAPWFLWYGLILGLQPPVLSWIHT